LHRAGLVESAWWSRQGWTSAGSWSDGEKRWHEIFFSASKSSRALNAESYAPASQLQTPDEGRVRESCVSSAGLELKPEDGLALASTGAMSSVHLEAQAASRLAGSPGSSRNCQKNIPTRPTPEPPCCERGPDHHGHGAMAGLDRESAPSREKEIAPHPANSHTPLRRLGGMPMEMGGPAAVRPSEWVSGVMPIPIKGSNGKKVNEVH